MFTRISFIYKSVLKSRYTRENIFFYKSVLKICLYLWENCFFYEIILKICLYLWEKFFFYKSVLKICLYLWEIFLYKDVLKSSCWLYKENFPCPYWYNACVFVPFFLWWVKNWKKKIDINFFLRREECVPKRSLYLQKKIFYKTVPKNI